MTFQEIRTKLTETKGRRNQVITDLKEAVQKRKDIEKEIQISEKAQAIISAVAKTTQSELEYRITEPVSLALTAVYDKDPYKMVADFKIAGRGTTECYLGFERNGNIVKPVDGSGGGTIDVASFSLQVGSWSLKKPRSRNVLLMDEPAKWVQRDKVPLFGQMITEISREMEMQFIIISHIPELIDCADRIIWIKGERPTPNSNKVSSVRFAGDIKELTDYLLKEEERLKEEGKRPTTYERHLFNHFLR